MNLQQNYERLKQLTEQIDKLKNKDPFSQEFKIWKSAVERFLAQTWKDNTEYLEQFKRIKYAKPTKTPRFASYEALFETNRRAKDFFDSRLDEAKLLLKSFLEEIPRKEFAIKEQKHKPFEKEKIQKSLKMLLEDLSDTESGPDRNTFGFKHRLKEIFKTLEELEPEIINVYPDIEKFSTLETYDELDYSRGDSGMAQFLKSRINKWLIETDYEKPLSLDTNVDKIQILENVLVKFPRVARQLVERRKEKGQKRPTIIIKDEYDVQDLLASILKINFEIVKKEIGTEHYAGGASRMDIVLDNEKIVIEVKMVRKDHSLKDLADELIVDIDRYISKYSCKFLYFFIYDPTDRLPNLPELEKDISRTQQGVIIKIIYSPKK